jgi:hypothetical protein
MVSRGFVGIFAEPLSKKEVGRCVDSWLERFEKVEQITPTPNHTPLTQTITRPADIVWEEHVQFRVLRNGEFAWIYITQNRRAMETTGLPSDEISLCLDVLLELPGIQEVIDIRNERRLDECEAQGLL